MILKVFKCMIYNNISIGIFICESFKQHCNILKDTVLKHFENFLFFGVSEDIYLPCYTHPKVEGDDYNSALSKQFLCMKKQFEKHAACDWFYVGGYDIFIHPDNLDKLLKKFDSNDDLYIGGHYDYRTIGNENILFASGGPGFIISRGLMNKMYDKLEQYIERWKNPNLHSKHVEYSGCDVALAYFLKEDFNIALTCCEGFYHHNYYEYVNASKNKHPVGCHLNYELVQYPIAFHNIKTENLLVELYNKALNCDMPFENCCNLNKA